MCSRLPVRVSSRAAAFWTDSSFLSRVPHSENSCQLFRFTPTAQYPMVSSDVSIPHARRRSRLVTARLRQCCAGGLTSLPVQTSAVSAQRCCAIHRRPTALRPHHWHTRQFQLVEGSAAYSVQAGDNRLSFTEQYGSSLPGCRSAPFVWYAVQTTSQIVTHWPARCLPVAVFYCWRPSSRCGWCSTMEVCHMTSSWVTHCHISVVDSKHFYLDSHILLFCFSSPCGHCVFYLGQS